MFKNLFILRMKKLLDIDNLDFCSFLHNSSHKQGNNQLELESNFVLGTNKKGKKLFGNEKIAIEINY